MQALRLSEVLSLIAFINEEQIKKVTTGDWRGQLRTFPALEDLSLAVSS